jgi:hypothetical protein
MLRRLRHLIPAITGYFGVAAMVWAGSGYLPTIGPVPLRFRNAPEPIAISSATTTNAPTPPPAPPPLPLAFMDLPPEAPIPTNGPDVDPPISVLDPKLAEPYVAEAKSPAPLPATAADPVVSPEMLVKYFAQPGPTNVGNSTPSNPQVGFTPPLLEARPQNFP